MPRVTMSNDGTPRMNFRVDHRIGKDQFITAIADDIQFLDKNERIRYLKALRRKEALKIVRDALYATGSVSLDACPKEFFARHESPTPTCWVETITAKVDVLFPELIF